MRAVFKSVEVSWFWI